MNATQPSMTPGQVSGSTAASRPGLTPSAPPPTLAAARNNCGCNNASGRSSAMAIALPPTTGMATMAAPSLRPSAGAAAGVAATWQSNVHVAGLWSINQDRNCWVYLDTVGWRNLSGASESGLVSLNMLASHAHQLGSSTSCYEEDDGRISQIYVW